MMIFVGIEAALASVAACANVVLALQELCAGRRGRLGSISTAGGAGGGDHARAALNFQLR